MHTRSKMTLDDAKAQLEALPGVYEVRTGVGRSTFDSLFDDAKPDYVLFAVRIASPEIVPEETRQGILRIQDTLERQLGCVVSVSVSAGLRMPDGAAS